MESVTLIYILIAIGFGAAGAIVTYFILQNKKDQTIDETQDSIQSSVVNKLTEEYKLKIQEHKNKISELDEKLEKALDKSANEAIKNQLIENEKLINDNTEIQDYLSNYKEKVKNLEEDIEDYQDDIASEKRKLTAKNVENEELQDSIKKHAIRNRELNEKIEQITYELKQKTAEYNIKSISLKFVEEILSAEELKEDEIADSGPIDKMVEYIEELRDILTVDRQMLKRWAITQKKHWIKNKTTIAFVGEFSAGKTSIVNRILSQDNPNAPLLPVNTKATTAIPTYISSGKSTRYRFVSPDDVLKHIKEETFKQVSKEVLDQVKGASNLLSHFVMSYKNDNLKNLSMLDTPGFNSNDKRDAERTIAVINECDALFWVMDVNTGAINKSSIELIRNHLQKPLYVVINKVDTKATSEVLKVEELMRTTFNNAGIQVKKFIHFSEKANIDNIMKPILSVKSSNGQDLFLKNLSNQLKHLEKQNELLVQNTRSKFDKEMNKVNTLTDKFNSVIVDLQQNFETAASKLILTKHMFKKDRYEMSKEEGDNLIDVLTSKYEKQLNDVKDIYDEQLESSSKARKSLEVWYNHLDKLGEINDYCNNFSKRTQLLKAKKQ